MPSFRPSWTVPQTIWLAVLAATLPWLPFPAPRPVPPRDASADARPPGSVFLYEETLEANAGRREDYEALPGIGPATARRLVDTRDAAGGFCTLDEVRQAGRLSAATWGSARPRIRLAPPESCATRPERVRGHSSSGP